MNLLDHIALVADLACRPDLDFRALAADEHLRFELYRAANPADDRAFLEVVLRDPDHAMAVAAAVARIDDRGKALPDFVRWADHVRPAVAHVEFVRSRLDEWCLLCDALAGKPVSESAVLAASDWAQRKLAAEVDGDLLALLAVHGRTRRVRAMTRVPRPVRPRPCVD
ncbi:hypothetical protein [Actinokineospora iranica]|uniref:Uncharacterized protein n=1 Tax=Actinokineospora iranica TaxID=1271860 RepID=A0A1G6W8Q5_9PSEU|nr:hypothetical protein [Actinokineospora iranica]SDD61426.1 hypothetical protein SAMN05216174_11436 [Actinokineospora iranica]